MRAIIDSSSLISLAWSGQLTLLERVPLSVVVISSVYNESVTEGLSRGHADAAAIEHALRHAERTDDPAEGTVDEMVVAAARSVGTVIANDLVLGRRANNVGARWLRTADLVVLGRASGALDPASCRAAVVALQHAGRITGPLRDAYLEELS
jgi:hypothetical protein